MPRPRVVNRSLRHVLRVAADDVARLRQDAGLTRAELARAAGIDDAFLLRVERGDVRPSIQTLVAVADALGADVTVRLYPNTGPRIHDRHQALIADALLRLVSSSWRAVPEVAVRRPARGYIDLVLAHRSSPIVVATEIESGLHRIEQQLRWAQEKAESLPSARIWSELTVAGERDVSRLLVVRWTRDTRATAAAVSTLLGAAYPADPAAALAALGGEAEWAGPALLWAKIVDGHVTLCASPPKPTRALSGVRRSAIAVP